MYSNLFFQPFPIVSTNVRFVIPQIKLQLSLRCRRTFVRLIMSFFNSYFHRRFTCSKVNRFKNLLIHFLSFITLERYSHLNKSISKSLNTNTNRSIFHVGIFCFFNRIIVFINNLLKNTQLIASENRMQLQFTLFKLNVTTLAISYRL